MTTDTLARFLKARIDEDEAKWRQAQAERGGTHWPWLEDRMLREVEAKRAILNEHPQERVGGHTRHRNDIGCALCHSDDGVQWNPGYCKTVRHLAAVYSDHPDYRAEWAPDA